MSAEIAFFGEFRTRLGESPLWDWRSNRLFWIDSVARTIWSAAADGASVLSWEMPAQVGSIALADDGLLVALAEGFHAFALTTGALTELSLPERGNPAVRFNDGKADRQGQFLSGTMRHGETQGAPGKLYRLGTGGAEVLERDIMLANGLCFSPDGATLYFADSLQSTIWAYDYSVAGVSNRRVFLDTTSLGSVPDGATVDADGHLWVALVLADKLARIAPDGTVVAELPTPMPYPACPAFGGPDLATLYVTSLQDTGGSIRTDHADGGRILAITGLATPGLREAVCPIPTGL